MKTEIRYFATEEQAQEVYEALRSSPATTAVKPVKVGDKWAVQIRWWSLD